MNGTVYLDREIDAAAAKHHPVRYPIISASLTDRADVGGLELSVSRVTSRRFRLTSDRFCAMSVVRGRGVVWMADQECAVAKHDHFGVPANLTVEMQASGSEPFVLLDAVLKPSPRRD
jgi:mannose-6-phosphate isomerase-like protein (cupin superfamily)